MKYKVLLIGEASDIVEKFLAEGDCFFECAAVSLRTADLETSIRQFHPNVIVYCMEKEDSEQMLNVSKAAGLKSETRIPLAIIGGQYDYDLYMVFTGKGADLFLQKANPFNSMLESLLLYVGEMDAEIGTVHSMSGSENKRKHIMVIDDSPNVLRAIANMLSIDYEVATAISGKVAWRYLQSRTVDLILLDYEMPDEDGIAVYRKLRKNPVTAGIPVIFLSGAKDVDRIQEAFSIRPEGYLFKPVDASTLLEKVYEILFCPK